LKPCLELQGHSTLVVVLNDLDVRAQIDSIRDAPPPATEPSASELVRAVEQVSAECGAKRRLVLAPSSRRRATKGHHRRGRGDGTAVLRLQGADAKTVQHDQCQASPEPLHD